MVSSTPHWNPFVRFRCKPPHREVEIFEIKRSIFSGLSGLPDSFLGGELMIGLDLTHIAFRGAAGLEKWLEATAVGWDFGNRISKSRASRSNRDLDQISGQ